MEEYALPKQLLSKGNMEGYMLEIKLNELETAVKKVWIRVEDYILNE